MIRGGREGPAGRALPSSAAPLDTQGVKDRKRQRRSKYGAKRPSRKARGEVHVPSSPREKARVLPDPSSAMSSPKFMNTLMYAGKKSVAERIVYAPSRIEAKHQGRIRCRLFHEALDNVKPRSRSGRAASAAPPTRCRSRFARSGGQALAIRWIIQAARARSRPP